MPASESQIVLLTGGLGGARLAPCLRDALGPDRLTVVANVGDDLTWHGLRAPDLDSVTYALGHLCQKFTPIFQASPLQGAFLASLLPSRPGDLVPDRFPVPRILGDAAP